MEKQLKIKNIRLFVILGLAIAMLAASGTWVMAQSEGEYEVRCVFRN